MCYSQRNWTKAETGQKQKPPLHPIPTERPFQIVGVDIMELPVTTRDNKYVVVFKTYSRNGRWFIQHQIKRLKGLLAYW